MNKKLQINSTLLVSLLISLISLTDFARADVEGSSVDNGNGTFTYAYLVNNSSGSFDIAAFSLEFNFLSSQVDWNQLDVAGGGDVSVPNGSWIAQGGIPTLSLSAQDFLSLNPAGDVVSGASLSGFSFTSSLAPGAITYFFEFGASGESSSGVTVGPVASAVPDSGSSMAMFVISMGFICGARGWSRSLKRDE